MKFTELNLEEPLLEAISYMGFDEATPVQENVIPVILQHRDLIACAQTGTGKTAAYVLPVLNKLIGKKDHSTDTLIIVPTRELAIQIDQQIQGFSYFIPAQSIAIYGGGSGQDWDSEANALKRGADIIIATPGRLLSHLKMGKMHFGKLRHLILDEADRMLDMGFIEDIRSIVSALPAERQTLLFSATMPAGIRKLAKTIMTEPVEISLSVSVPAKGIDQKIYLSGEKQKSSVLNHILGERKHYKSIIIFTSTRSKIKDIVRSLEKSGFAAQGFSSSLEQDKREEVLAKFRSGNIRILVATDVMSRGIDIKDINLVLNYDTPRFAEDYVHRVGRTARVDAIGEAITLVTPAEMHKLAAIEKLIKTSIPRVQLPEGIISDTVPVEREEKVRKKRFKGFRRKNREKGSGDAAGKSINER